MSSRVTWVELLDSDPARAFRLREEEENERAAVKDLLKELAENEAQIRHLERENRQLTQEQYRNERALIWFRRFFTRLRGRRRKLRSTGQSAS
jgi:small-conductance mechanosensitive channel